MAPHKRRVLLLAKACDSGYEQPRSVSQTDVDAAIKRAIQLYHKAINDLYTSFQKDNDTYEFAITLHKHKDSILSRSGYPGARKMAGKWREVLQIETLFYSDEEIYQHLQAAGCTKGYQAVKRWIHEDVIAPDSKQDLAQIAKATQSDVLAELLDQVYDSAQTVRSAHIQAGRVLTNLLRQKIVSALHERGEIDPLIYGSQSRCRSMALGLFVS